MVPSRAHPRSFPTLSKCIASLPEITASISLAYIPFETVDTDTSMKCERQSRAVRDSYGGLGVTINGKHTGQLEYPHVGAIRFQEGWIHLGSDVQHIVQPCDRGEEVHLPGRIRCSHDHHP